MTYVFISMPMCILLILSVANDTCIIVLDPENISPFFVLFHHLVCLRLSEITSLLLTVLRASQQRNILTKSLTFKDF